MTNKVDWTKTAKLPPEELDRLLDEDSDEVDDNPPATDEQLAAAVPEKRRPGQRGPGKRPAKVLLTVRVEPEPRNTLAALRAAGPGWQGRVQTILRDAATGLLIAPSGAVKRPRKRA